MKSTNWTRRFVFLLALTTAWGCGHGGGGVVQPTKAVVMLSMQGETVQTIGGVQASLLLPSGVTVKATQNAPQTDDGVVVSPGADLVMAVYSASTNSVSVYVAKSSGMETGVFATVNCDIAVGSFPRKADFAVTDLSVWNIDGAPVAGLTASLTVTID